MFDEAEKAFQKGGIGALNNTIKDYMPGFPPAIYNHLYPSVTSLAIQTRIQLINARKDLEELFENKFRKVPVIAPNEQKAYSEQNIFHESILRSFNGRIQSIQQKLDKIF